MIIFCNVTTNDKRIVFYLNIINMKDNHSAFPICYSRSLLQHFYYSSAVLALRTFYQNWLAFPQLWTFHMLIRYTYHIFILKKFEIDSNVCFTIVMHAVLTLISSCTNFYANLIRLFRLSLFCITLRIEGISTTPYLFHYDLSKIANVKNLDCI